MKPQKTTKRLQKDRKVCSSAALCQFLPSVKFTNRKILLTNSVGHFDLIFLSKIPSFKFVTCFSENIPSLVTGESPLPTSHKQCLPQRKATIAVRPKILMPQLNESKDQLLEQDTALFWFGHLSFLHMKSKV